jgi:hypothetical protein
MLPIVVGGSTVLQRRWFAALFLVFGLAAPVFGQEAVKLEWKFDKGKTFYQEVTTETKQDMKVMGMDINQTQKQTFYFSWTVKDKTDKEITLVQKIEGVNMDINIGGNQIKYDSTQDAGAANPLSDFFKALVGTEFTVTVDAKTLAINDVKGGKEFQEKLVKANQQMEPLLKQILNDKALKEMAAPTFSAIQQGTPVKKGDTWKRTSSLDMGPIGKYDTTYTYTYEGKQDKLDKIGVKTEMTYTQPPANATGLPFTIKSADLKSKDGKGTVLFDNDKGRLASSDMEMKLTGKLSIDIGGMTTEVTLDQTQKTTVKTSDESPIKKK